MRMRDTMVHRGPDDAGLWISDDRKAGLGHRRLSIVDLSSSAKQPMCNEDGSLWVSFNGEIYNHLEIRSELNRIGGHTWKTDHSDTEVILHAFEEWGIDCIHRFRGMFAIALWDTRSSELWLVRDRMGIKPLYYSIHHGRITFASEIKALLQDPDQKKNVDETSLYYFLSFLATPPPSTLFEGIKKLAGGTYLHVKKDGQYKEDRYWDMWDHTTPFTGISEDEIAARLLNELETSVQLRKMADVPVGVFLSGGIDSSANAALFSKGQNTPVQTFTIGYDGDYKTYQNETYYARMMAGEVGAEYHERILSVDDLISFLPKMVYLQDEPIADPVCVPLYYVSELARKKGVIVCQVGEGADELFWGYLPWKENIERQERMNRIPKLLGSLSLAALRLLGRDQGPGYEQLHRNVMGRPIFWGGAESFRDTYKRKLLSTRLNKKFKNYSSWEAIDPIFQRFQEKAWDKSSLHWMTYLDLNYRLPELLLMRVDKMSMGVSVESRVPFLDHKFVEFVMSIPSGMKTKNGTQKYILKKALKGVIPDAIIHRKKQGFGVPIHEWFFDKLGERAHSEVLSFAGSTDYFNMDEIKTILREDKYTRSRWYLLNLALWWKMFIQS